MNTRKHLTFSLALAALFAAVLRSANAQELHCELFKELVNMAATDTSFHQVRAKETQQKGSKDKEYECLVELWKPDGYIVQGQYIRYSDFEHRYTYYSTYDDGASGSSEKEEVK